MRSSVPALKEDPFGLVGIQPRSRRKIQQHLGFANVQMLRPVGPEKSGVHHIETASVARQLAQLQ